MSESDSDKSITPVEEEQPAAEEAAEASPPPADDADFGARRSFFSGLIPKLAIVVAICAVLIASALWWQYRQFYVELSNEDEFLQLSLEEMRAAIRQYDDQIQGLDGDLGASRAEVESLADDVEALPAELRALGRRVEALQGGQIDARDNWLREQAEYYLVLANSEAAVAGRIDTAMTALELADDVLRDLGDPSLTDVRRAIAAELQDLRSVDTPDLEGLAADLGGLIVRVPDLPMRAEAPQNFEAEDVSLEDVEPGVGRLLARTRNAVTSIVRVERQEEEIGVVLTDTERRIVRRQLALELQLARTALLERRQEMFRSSLIAADDILNREFDREMQSIVESRRLLGNMMQVELAPELPDISDSLTLLRTAPGSE